MIVPIRFQHVLTFVIAAEIVFMLRAWFKAFKDIHYNTLHFAPLF